MKIMFCLTFVGILPEYCRNARRCKPLTERSIYRTLTIGVDVHICSVVQLDTVLDLIMYARRKVFPILHFRLPLDAIIKINHVSVKIVLLSY